MSRELIQIVDQAVAEAARQSGAWITCRRGCVHCCIGPFTITSLDAARLREGLELLPLDEACRVTNRAREAAARMGGAPPRDSEEDAFCAQHAGVPCPVLDLETGACALYEHRPIACRLHGPAMRIDEVNLRHCRLNYTGATEAQIEDCRVEVNPAGAEDRAIAEFEAQGGRCYRTYIAFSFTPPAEQPSDPRVARTAETNGRLPYG